MLRQILLVVVLAAGSLARAELLPLGVLDDDQTSIIYYPDTGEVAVDVPSDKFLQGIQLVSAREFFGECPPQPGFEFCDDSVFRFSFGQLLSFSFGHVAQPGLSVDYVLNDLTVSAEFIPRADNIGPFDLIYMQELSAGDANRDFAFDQNDIVRVLEANKYLTGQSATWGEGDWNGAPGGYPGEPPLGDGLFNQIDIVTALQSGLYLSGAHLAIGPNGLEGDGQASVGYDGTKGEIWVEPPAGREFTLINIDSLAGIFTGDRSPDVLGNCGFAGELCGPQILFKATFGGSFGRYSFGNAAQTGLSQAFILNDLTVVGSLAGGGDLGPVDLIYLPEQSATQLLIMGVALSAIIVVPRSTSRSLDHAYCPRKV